MNGTSVVLLRLPAFIIDFSLIMAVIISINKLGIYLNVFSGIFSVEVLMFIYIPLGFFFYWWAGINLGKRLFRLHIIDATTGNNPTIFQYFRRCLLFSLVISLNLIFLIPLFVSKRNQGFHDMLANTLVVRKDIKQES